MANEVVDIDFDVWIANKSPDEDIIAEVSGYDAIETEEESDEERIGVSDDATKQSLNKVMQAITVLENYGLYSNFGDDLTKALKDINCVLTWIYKLIKDNLQLLTFFLKM